MREKLIIGSLENCNLPDIGIRNLQMRVDTGARTSALHVDNLKKIIKEGRPWVAFDIHPNVHDVDEIIHCESPLHDIRTIKSSNGSSEERYIIKTAFEVVGQKWNIEISLSDRSDMSNLMLFGRQGMKDRVLVDPSRSFILESRDD